MSEELIPMAPIEEKMSQELVKANVTEAVIASLRERYMPLKIAGLEDKETYLQVKEGRKECKSLRVMAKKICTNGREEATAIQKAWIAKEKEVTGQIAEVEDYLEAQEKEYEAGIAAEKEARKRKQEEQLILRQQELTGMGALYTDGNFVLGNVSFEYSAIKESEDDIWKETIYPSFFAEYQKIQAEEMLKEQLRKEQEEELKRKEEEIAKKQKELEEKEAELKREAERQEKEAVAKAQEKLKSRGHQLISIGHIHDVKLQAFTCYGMAIPEDYLKDLDDEKWDRLISLETDRIKEKREEEAEEKRKEQERIELQKDRYAELFPYRDYADVDMGALFALAPEAYSILLIESKKLWATAEEEKTKKITEDAAKAERERIEEEQRQAEAKRIKELREFRIAALGQYNVTYNGERGELGALTEDQWWAYINDVKATHDEIIRKQEEERRAEELAQAGDKEKWKDIMDRLNAIDVHSMRSSQYRKKAAILREKLEEIKSL